MAVSGISGLSITGTLSDGNSALKLSEMQSDSNKFNNLLQSMKKSASDQEAADKTVSSVASSQIASNHRLNGDYTQGFYGTFTSEADKNASPKGIALGATTKDGKKAVIDKTSELYAQSMEFENYMIKMMLSSMRNTVQKSGLLGTENDYASKMYEDMMYDNYAENLTKNSEFGLADQIYLELSGQK